MKLTVLLSLLLTIAVAKPDWSTLITSEKSSLRFTPRCRPLAIQRDVLCGCYVGQKYGLMTGEAVRKCMATFRAGIKKMKESCGFYKTNGAIKAKKLVKNLTFIHEYCPLELSREAFPIAARMLTPEEIREILAEIEEMILEILRALNRPGASIGPGERMIMTGTNAESIKVARLVSYNNIKM